MLGLDRVVDEDWFARMYADSYRRLVLVAYALTNDLEAAEGITQEAFASAFARRAILVDADSPEAWVRGVVVHLARRRARWMRAVPDWIRRRRHGEPEPATPADLRAAVRTLSEEHRSVLALHHLGDLPVDEIASIVDIPIETVRSQLSDARAALATRLGDEVDDVDLDARLAQVREELRESVPEPELHETLVRSRHRVNGRRMRVGAVIAVVVVATAIPVLRTALRPVPDTAGAATTSTTSVPAVVPGMYPDEPLIIGLDFADATHGFVLKADCASGPRCRNTLLATEDGARWEPRSMPEPRRETDHPTAARLLALGPREIVLGEWFPMEREHSTRWHSDDAGATWRELPAKAEETTESIPPGAAMEYECTDPAEPMTECRKTRFLITLPGSGRRVALANQPPLERMWPEQIPAADGNWWVAGVHPGTEKWALAVSRNAGRHWTVLPMPEVQGSPPQRLALSAGPNVLYLSAMGNLPDTPHGLLAIFRSTDGGKTWEQTWQATARREPRGAYAVVLAADGSVRVISPFGKQYVSTNGGKEFVEDASSPPGGSPLGWAWRTKAGYVEQAIDSPNTLRLSPDGVTWKDLAIPLK